MRDLAQHAPIDGRQGRPWRFAPARLVAKHGSRHGHTQRGGQPLPAHVADHDPLRVPIQAHKIVQIPAQITGGQRYRSNFPAGQPWSGFQEQALLQVAGQLQLLLKFGGAALLLGGQGWGSLRRWTRGGGPRATARNHPLVSQEGRHARGHLALSNRFAHGRWCAEWLQHYPRRLAPSNNAS
jgi:hypothetical protein